MERTSIQADRHRPLQGRSEQVDEICSGHRALSANTALRLGRLFGVDAQSWMNLQGQYELEVAARALSKRLNSEVTPPPEAA